MKMAIKQKKRSSGGHTLGEFIGDWFERFFVLPLLAEVATKLDLFLDTRFILRSARGAKITWDDEEGNTVNYDFVLELGGTQKRLGLPVAFLECCWRRGTRHSKDKARDDSGKLIPMRSTYPTARFLGMIVGGDFTPEAGDLVRSREIDLFYVPKKKIVRAFSENQLIIDYADKAGEREKMKQALSFERSFTSDMRMKVAQTLVELVGRTTIHSYVDRVRARLSALPQEIRLILRHESTPLIFTSANHVTEFLERPTFQMDNPVENYVYEVTYSDGAEFRKTVPSVGDLRGLHGQIQTLSEHMAHLI